VIARIARACEYYLYLYYDVRKLFINANQGSGQSSVAVFNEIESQMSDKHSSGDGCGNRGVEGLS